MKSMSSSIRVPRLLAAMVLGGFLVVTVPSPVSAAFVRGDSNQDGFLDISDARFTLDFLFTGGEPPECPAAADTNDDEVIDISDPVAALEFLFLGGEPPPPPYPAPGGDPTPGLGCGVEPPQRLVCAARGPAVDLSWQNPESYDAIVVARDGEPIVELPAGTTSFRDTPPAGGTLAYDVRGTIGGEASDAVTCTVRNVPSNRPPTLVILSPAQGTTIDGDSFSLRGRVDDDSGIARVVVGGVDVAVPPGAALPHTFTANVARGAQGNGPRLVRVEAVDVFGRVVFAELAVGFAPLLAKGAAAAGLTLDVSGSSGYDEIETIARPFLADLPALLNTSVRGVQLFNSSILGVDITATGDRVEIVGPIGFDLFPSAANGGRVGLRASLQTIRFFANGRSDFGFLGTDNWTATWTGNNVTITGAIAFAPTPDGSGLTTVSDGFVVAIGSSDFSVSGFLDPVGIFDAVVNTLSGLFAGTIEDAVRSAVETAANDQIVPLLGDAFSGLSLDLDLGLVALDTSFADVRESASGLSFLFDGGWRLTEPESAGYPRFPGSYAEFAPFPNFPLGGSPGFPVDATISLSRDTLNQALAGLTATGLLVTDLGFDGVASPIPLDAGTIAAILEPRFSSLDGVDADDPLGIHVEARFPPRILLNEGTFGIPVIAVGEEWRWAAGRSQPPANWNSTSFRDTGWNLGQSGFGYSSDASELRAVRTVLDDMAAGEYTSIYVRKTFELANPATLAGLVLRVEYDDAFVAYVNGVEVGRRNIGTAGTPPTFDTLAAGAGETMVAEIDLLAFRASLRSGSNLIAIQGHNASATSSDFVLVPSIIEATPLPAGAIASLPAQILLEDLLVSFVADTAADGVGETDADGRADEVELFAYALGLRLQTQLLLVLGDDGVPTLLFRVETSDGPDPDSFPDGVVGGLGGVAITVAGEAFDLDDAALVEFAQLVLAVFGPSLGETLGALELPAVPLPELAFDLDQDGTPEVRLEILRGNFVPVDTTGDGATDWLCIQTDLRSVAE